MLRLLVLNLCAVCILGASDTGDQRLVWQGKGDAPQWLPAKVVANMTNYMDITDHQHPKVQPSAMLNARRTKEDPYPTETRFVDVAKDLIDRAESTSQNLKESLFHLSSYWNRYYVGVYGQQSSASIYTRILGWISLSGRTDVSVRIFEHSWDQNSIIARFEGTSPNEEAVIIGAHEDSINLDVELPDRPFARAPGADDDGSGTVTIMEAFRVFLMTGFQPTRPVEFQWYAAEEIGLLGSQDIATNYSAINFPIHAMLQVDMCGGVPGSDVGAIIMDDFSPPDLSDYLALILDSYVSFNGSITYGVCGACSDHVSFARVGYPAVFPIESENAGGGHSADDIPEKLDFVFMFEWVKLVLGFVLELAHP